MIRRKNINLALEYNHHSDGPQIYLNNDSVLEYNHRSTDRPTEIFLSKMTAYRLNTMDYTRNVDESFQAMMDRDGSHDENYQEFEVYAQRRDGKLFGASMGNGEQYGDLPDDDDDDEDDGDEEDDDGSDDDSDGSDTEYLKLQSVPHGYIVNSDVFLTTEQWHCLMPQSDGRWYCALCDKHVETHKRTEHTKDKIHERNMVLCAPQRMFELSISRRIYDKYHCGVCNELMEESAAMAHFETKEHEEKKLFACNKASDITYDYKLDDSANNSYSLNENNCYVRNNHSDRRNNNKQDRDNHVIEYNPNDPKNNGCNSGYNNGCQSPSISYATMAKKAQAVALPTFLRVDLGNRVIEVRFDAWHMIVYSRGGLHCMACNVTAPRRTRAEHCRSPAHKERLRGCRVLPEYGEYLVRQVNDHLYHCGHCNNLKPIHDMVDHIADNHPTITKVIKHVPPRNTTNSNNTTNANSNTANAEETPSLNINNTEITNTAREIKWRHNTEITNTGKEMQSKSVNHHEVEEVVPESVNDNIWGENTFNTAVEPNKSGNTNTEIEIQLKSVDNDVVSGNNTSSTDSKHLFDVPSAVKSLTGRNFFSTRRAKIGINETNTDVTNNTINTFTTVSELEKNIRNVPSDNKHSPQTAAADRNTVHIERTENNTTDFPNGVPNIEVKIPENCPAFDNSPNNTTNEVPQNISTIPNQNVPLNPIQTQNSYTFDPNTTITMFIFGHNVTMNLLAMNTIIQLGALFTCSLCDVKLGISSLVDHILNDLTHKERLDGTPFIPEFLCNLIRPIRCNFLHCAICNTLVPYDKRFVHAHVTTPYHTELVHRSVAGLSPRPPTDVAPMADEDSDAEDPDADTELTEYTLAKLKKIYIKIETVAWHSLVSKGDGDVYCFVCSLALSPELVPRHVRTKKHGGNIRQCKILGNNYGTNLFRQILDTFHCLNCNVILSKSNIQRHLDWPAHTHNTHTSFERDGDMPVKEILTQKQTNSKQSRGQMTIEYDVVIDKSTEPVHDEQAALRPNKIVRCGGELLKIRWESWHGVAVFKDGYRCKLCQTDIGKNDLASHVRQVIHVDYVQNGFSQEYRDAVLRIISESRLHCLICNVDLCLTENVRGHVVGKRHDKHRRQILEESSRVNAFNDCDTKNIVFI